MSISIWKLLLVLAAIILIFGTKKLPQAMTDIAKGMKQFKKSMDGDDEKPSPKSKTKKTLKKK